MVCKECGAYNAEHLTHCRVCAAKLRDDSAAAPAAPAREENADRPAREFAAAPSWPKSAFSGAPENPPLKAAASAAPKTEAASGAAAQRPALRSTLQQPAEPATRRACPHCGKATLADAPYCAYCGELLNGPAKAASAMPAAAPAAMKKAAAHAAPVDDFDDDYDDYDDEDDPKPAKKRSGRQSKKSNDADDDFDDEEYDDEDYDDEDYDDEDYDELPKKRGKGTTILFWGLIILLIAVIGICGKVIADRNFDGDFGKMFASIGSIFGGKQDASAETAITEDGGDAAATSAAMYTATISPYTDSAGNRYFDVNVIAPTGSKVQVVSSAALETSEATVPDYDNVILRVAEAVFLPNAPCDSETVTVTPSIQAVTADGQTIPISVDPITITVPVLSLTLESPAESSVQATFANDPIVITGTVDDPTTEDDHSVEVYINDVRVDVYAGGTFTYNYTPTIAPTVAATPADTSAATDAAATAADPSAEATTPPEGTTAGGLGETVTAAGDDTTVSDEEAASDDTAAAADAATTAATGAAGTETITVEARKNNCVTARTVITVQPYVFQNMSLLVSNDAAAGVSADTSSGALTLQGTVTPGAVMTASCDSDKVSIGEPTVSATGNFTIAVTISAVGAYNIKLTATQDGYNEAATTTIVERAPADTYKKFKTGASDLSSIIAKVTSGETTSGDVYFTGTVTEILGTSPYTVFKVKLSDDTEVVCVNRSAKSKINSGDVKQKKQLFGSLFGFYNDSTMPYIWVWFILNK